MKRTRQIELFTLEGPALLNNRPTQNLAPVSSTRCFRHYTVAINAHIPGFILLRTASDVAAPQRFQIGSFGNQMDHK